jgi:hypothetical protein
MNDREQRGLALAALYRIEQADGKYVVPSQGGNGTTHIVGIEDDRPQCACRDHTGGVCQLFDVTGGIGG